MQQALEKGHRLRLRLSGIVVFNRFGFRPSLGKLLFPRVFALGGAIRRYRWSACLLLAWFLS